MRHEVSKLLEDIRQAAERIQRITSGKKFAEFCSDEVLPFAVERLFEIAGEALTRLVKLEIGIAEQIGAYRKIIDFRNVIIHGYDAIKPEIVWDAVQIHLPILKKQVEDLLAGESHS